MGRGKSNNKILIFFGVLSLVFFYIGTLFGNCLGTLKLENILLKAGQALTDCLDRLTSLQLAVRFDSNSMLYGFFAFLFVWLMWVLLYGFPKNTRYNEEYGSAHWGTPNEIKPYTAKKYQDNIILTATEQLSMESRMPRTKTDDFNRNKNVLVIGGAGSGKTRFFVKPNLMQMHSNYVVTDSKGSIIHECGKMLAEKGHYEIKVFDLINPTKSDQYNPFNYLHTESDVLKLINNIIANTTGKDSKAGEDFWVKAETALLEAIFAWLLFHANKEDQTISNALEMIRLAEVQEEDENFVSPLDIIFDKLEKENPNEFCVKQYDIYKKAAGKTAKSILISVGVRLAPFNIPEIANLVSTDTIHLEELGSNKKVCIFVILPDTDTTFNFLAAIMYQQLFDILVYRADNEFEGRLPRPVRFLLDEFANVGKISQFETLIATIRSREISVNIILQNLSQIKSAYEKTWEIITGNCDTLLFLGGMEQSTEEYISKMCGTATIDLVNDGQSKGQQSSSSLNWQKVKRELILPDEVGALKGRQCILKIRGCSPFMSYKYDITKHSNYKDLSDYNHDNYFEIADRNKEEVVEARFKDGLNKNNTMIFTQEQLTLS